MDDNRILDWLAAVAGVMTLGIYADIRRRISGTKNRLNKLEENSDLYVTREELERILQRTADERLRMHQENRQDLQYIRQRVDSMSGGIQR